MDQGLKQRLVGATVLIVLGVLLIPWFLDGSGMDQDSQSTLELPVPTPRTSVPASNDQSQPQSSAKSPSKPVSEPKVRVVEQKKPPPKREPKTEPVVAVKPAPASDPGSGWVAQVGSFSSESNANRLTAQLKKAGYPAFVMRHRANNKAMFRVRVGPEKERRLAEELARRLKREGHDSKVVSHP